jgi:hypothetical protein
MLAVNPMTHTAYVANQLGAISQTFVLTIRRP